LLLLLPLQLLLLLLLQLPLLLLLLLILLLLTLLLNRIIHPWQALLSLKLLPLNRAGKGRLLLQQPINRRRINSCCGAGNRAVAPKEVHGEYFLNCRSSIPFIHYSRGILILTLSDVEILLHQVVLGG